MPANPTQERRDLEYVLGLPNPSTLTVRVAISAQVTVQAETEAGPLTMVLQPRSSNGQPRVYDLLAAAPIATWRASATLRKAVENGWLFVDVDAEAPAGASPAVSDCCGIEPPANPQIGDLLHFDGSRWARLSPGDAGAVLTSHGTGSAITWVTPGLVELDYNATMVLDLALATPSVMATVSLAGDVIFSTAHLVAGKSMSLRIRGDSNERTLTFPATWKFLGGTIPETIAAGEDAILSFNAYGTTDAAVLAGYAVTVTEAEPPSS